MADRLMPTPEPPLVRAFPLIGEPGASDLGRVLARLLRDAPVLPGALGAAPGDPEEEAVEESDDLDDDDDLDDEDDEDGDDEEDFDDDDDEEEDEVEDEEET